MFDFNFILPYRKKFGETVENYECVDLNRKIHYFYGLWPPRDQDPSWFYTVQYIYHRLHLLFILAFLTVIYPVSIYNHSDDLLQVCEDLIVMFIFLMFFTKTGCMLYYRDRLEELGDELKRIWGLEHGYPMSKLEEEIRKETQRRSNILTMALCLFASVSGSFHLMLCVQTYLKRTFYISFWLPYDATVSPHFEITFILLAVIVVIPFVQMIYIDIYVGALMIHIVGQFNILRTNLKHIKTFAIQTLTARKSRELNSLPLLSTQSSLEESPAELLDVITSNQPTGQEGTNSWSTNSPISSMLSQGRSRAMAIREAKEHTLQEIDDEMQIRMKNCVEHHLHIISLVHDLEETMQIPTVVQICSFVVATSVSATWLTLVPVEDIDAKFIFFLDLTLCLAVDTTLYFYLGEQITQQSLVLRDAVYDCDWFEASEGFKRSMRIMMSMANQPLEWTAGYIVPLTLATFYDLSQMIYSYYTNTRKMILS